MIIQRITLYTLTWLFAAVLVLVGCGGSIERSNGLPPLITIDAAGEARINTVLAEIDGNYGGTLVVDPADTALDSSAFVQRYLRRFAHVTENRHTYSYRCERLLARLARFPTPLTDARLDVDIWQAYRLYEQKVGGASTYQEGNTVHIMHSTRDLLWMYFGAQAKAIWGDEKRRNWWLNRLLVDKATIEERQARTFAVLQLITAIRGQFKREQYVQVDRNLTPPIRAESLHWFAQQMQVSCVAIGVDLSSLPNPRIDEVNISGRMTVLTIFPIIDQESWSKERHFFHASFLVPIGQRGRYTSVRLPTSPISDGLFFFFSQDTLFVWPKKNFTAAIPQLLESVALLSPDERHDLAVRMGANEMPVLHIRKK